MVNAPVLGVKDAVKEPDATLPVVGVNTPLKLKD